MINIICINLLRATERKQYIIDQWVNKYNLNIEFVEAVDRRNIKNTNDNLSNGEIACIMSHLSTYEYIQKNNYKEALIIEDDAIPLFSNINELYLAINSTKEEFPNIDVLLLHSPRRWKHKQKIIQQKEYSRLIEGNPFGTYAYYIKNTGIDTIKDSLLSFKMPADHYWFLFGNKQKLAILNKHLVSHPVRGATTYIDRPRNRRRKFIE